MKNLHKINPTREIPGWAKRLILAFARMNGETYSFEQEWTYSYKEDAVDFNNLNPRKFTDGYESWVARGWAEYIDEVDLKKWPPHKLKLNVL